MSDLSPAAQAVLDATNQAYDQAATVAQGTAAALRAAADQVVPDIGYEADWHEPVAQELQYVRNRLLAIAAELESGNG